MQAVKKNEIYYIRFTFGLFYGWLNTLNHLIVGGVKNKKRGTKKVRD